MGMGEAALLSSKQSMAVTHRLVQEARQVQVVQEQVVQQEQLALMGRRA